MVDDLRANREAVEALVAPAPEDGRGADRAAGLDGEDLEAVAEAGTDLAAAFARGYRAGRESAGGRP